MGSIRRKDKPVDQPSSGWVSTLRCHRGGQSHRAYPRLQAISRKNGVFWESAGEGGSAPLPLSPKTIAAPEITLHLRKAKIEFHDDWRVRSIINKYSDHYHAPLVEIEKSEEKDGETVVSRERSTRRRRCGPVTSRKSKTTSTTSSTSTSPTTSLTR